MADAERYAFEAEWYDKVASMLKKFYLYYFPSDNSVELFNLKTRKTFLRRSKCEGVEAKDFYVGAVVTIFSRSMRITNFADRATRGKLASKTVKKFFILKSDLIDKISDILKLATEHDFHLSNIKMVKIDYEDAIIIFKSNDDQASNEIQSLTTGPIVAIELLSKDAKSRWHELYEIFEKKAYSNSIYIPENAEEVMACFFSMDKTKRVKIKNSAILQNCTCCIIKPHAVHAKLTASIVADIQNANFSITAMQQFFMEPVYAEEFLEVYKGVLPDYPGMVGELQSGPCIAMEITHKDPNFNVVEEFRKLCGPMDSEMARQLRPDTLRAKYGKTKIQNAVHCSDLPEDGILEVEYLFKIMES